MNINIDDSKSVQTIVDKISEHWFDPKGVYFQLKANGKTNSPDFWDITKRMLADVSESLGQTPEQFLDTWNNRCVIHSVKIMGYHCTRHSNKEVFAEKGILPLSDETIKIFEDKNKVEAIRMWEYRKQRSPGPFLLLSYRDARNPNNHFLTKGPEILLACTGYQVNADTSKSVPLIIHCAIPYSILPDKDYYVYCVLKAYFNFLDPEDDSNNLFEGYSIDLKGNGLDPRYVARIEEIYAAI